MKKAFSFVVVAGALFAQSAFACPTQETGPHFLGSGGYYNYSADDNCVAITGLAYPVTMWCYSQSANSVASTNTQFSYTFTVNHDLDYWDADIFVEFDDPNNSAGNWIQMWANVTHGSTTTPTLLWSHDGRDGDISCQRPGGSFEAEENDQVEIVVYAGRANSNATVQVSAPNIYGYF
ncbi:MAG TPA: hypothetical protein VEK11_10145 [Thermoanaerobaculia bacterium]|nr:hypothetical protein [Thermoanaerobaculia bacterium]